MIELVQTQELEVLAENQFYNLVPKSPIQTQYKIYSFLKQQMNFMIFDILKCSKI